MNTRSALAATRSFGKEGVVRVVVADERRERSRALQVLQARAYLPLPLQICVRFFQRLSPSVAARNTMNLSHGRDFDGCRVEA